jgi:hypothetical protein
MIQNIQIDVFGIAAYLFGFSHIRVSGPYGGHLPERGMIF